MPPAPALTAGRARSTPLDTTAQSPSAPSRSIPSPLVAPTPPSSVSTRPTARSEPTTSQSTGDANRRRIPVSVIMAGVFALGGLVGAAGFGLGQQYGDSAIETAAPIAPVTQSTPSPEATTTPPIPEDRPGEVSTEPAADVARILGPSVVQVETNRGQGSGVVYDDGLLLTNHHVIDGATEVRIRTASGRVVDVEVLGSDPRNDIAVLTAPRSRLPVAAIGSSAALEVGQLTVAIGSPFQLQQTVTAGIVSSVNRPVPNAAGGITAMIQTDAPINPGNSGGALANRDGDLVGINAAIRTDGVSNSNVGIGFAVPIDTAIEVADRIVAGESLDPGVLGVVGDRQDAGIGVPVADVIPDSGAAASGLQPGDRVLTVDGAPVTNVVELIGLIQSNFSGDTVELELNRNGAILTVEALLS